MNGGYYKFTILGCGSSPGVPRPMGDWGACDPLNPKNRRMRPSLLVERYKSSGEKTTIIVDTGSDFREQMLLAKVTHIDGVFYTHAHADHTHGIDDLRGYSYEQKACIPIYSNKDTLTRLKQSFAYCFTALSGSAYPPILKENEIFPGQSFSIEGAGGKVELLPLKQQHGKIISLGCRIENFAYCSDVSAFPEETFQLLSGVEVLVIDCLQYKAHPSHLSLEKAIDYIERINPKRAILTHMHIAFDYDQVQKQTPPHIEPAYDGLSIVMEDL